MTEESNVKKKLVKEDEDVKKEIVSMLKTIYKNMLEKECEDALEYVDWLKTKTHMRDNPEIEKSFPIFSKGVYYVNLGKNIGSEQEKDRPCILLRGSKISETVIVIPISDEKELDDGFWYHIPLSSGDTALVEQIRAVSKTRIRRAWWQNRYVRSILPSECTKINNALDKMKLYIDKDI